MTTGGVIADTHEAAAALTALIARVRELEGERGKCPLGDDCDLTVAWMAGQQEARDIFAARLDEARAREGLARADADNQRQKAEAALPAQGWRVKPLVWETHWTGGWQREFAKTPVGLEYHVNDQGWWFPADNLRICADRQKAKAAAQADYEARILAALEPAEAGGVEVDWGADVGREVLSSPVDAGGVEAMAEGTLE